MSPLKTTVLAVALALSAACAHRADKTTDMLAYEDVRDGEVGELIAERHPDLFAAAQTEYDAALQAHQDKDGELAAHHAKMANVILRTAAARSDTADAHASAKAAAARQERAEEEIGEVEARLRIAMEAVDRLERIASLEAKEGTFKAKDELANAMLAIKEAEFVNAREYATAELEKADEALESATAALESGDADGAIGHAKAAHKAAKSAKEAATPEYEKHNSRLAFEAQRRDLVAKAGKIDGVTARMTEGGITMTLHKLFGSGDVTIDSSRLGSLNGLADLASEYGDFTLVVEGHTDNRGGKSKNISLSQARADAVVAHLGTKGISPARMTSAGKGPASPIANNKTKAGRAENRRIEVIFVQPAR